MAHSCNSDFVQLSTERIDREIRISSDWINPIMDWWWVIIADAMMFLFCFVALSEMIFFSFFFFVIDSVERFLLASPLTLRTYFRNVINFRKPSLNSLSHANYRISRHFRGLLLQKRILHTFWMVNTHGPACLQGPLMLGHIMRVTSDPLPSFIKVGCVGRVGVRTITNSSSCREAAINN